jgi:hypothetical protein
MAGGFLAMAPLLLLVLPAAIFLIFLHAPGYMIHQVEEHAGDRFRTFVNDRMFGGLDVLRSVDILVINLPLVWGLNAAALYVAFIWGEGFGLAAPYAMLVNAFAHVGASVKFKGYNPGLATSILVFVPLSVVTIWVIGALPSVDLMHHAIGVVIALLVHILIVVHSASRHAALKVAPC